MIWMKRITENTTSEIDMSSTETVSLHWMLQLRHQGLTSITPPQIVRWDELISLKRTTWMVMRWNNMLLLWQFANDLFELYIKKVFTFLLSVLSLTFTVIRRWRGWGRGWRARGARRGRGGTRTGMWWGRWGRWWRRGGSGRRAGGGAIWVGLWAAPGLSAAPLASLLGLPLGGVGCEGFGSCCYHLPLIVPHLRNRFLLQTCGSSGCLRRTRALAPFLPALLLFWSWFHFKQNPTGLCISLGW